ncbi:MAG: DUF2793 domain-containing protein [Novosphingobium sp.]|nr:DUF2793 domain-containing protein [Novosphingobium sp.]
MSDPITFDSTTPRLALPLLFAGQSQKEFTVNEALLRTDLVLHCTVEGEVAVPPANPLAGQAWLVGANPTGAFAGHAAAIAGFTSGGWRFVAARTGLRVYDKSSPGFRHYTNAWQRCVAPATPVGGTTIDQEARTAIASIVEKLIAAGILATI